VHETLTGGPPFQRDEDIALLWAHQYDRPPPLTEKRPDIAPAADEVLAKALAKIPEDRYDSCLEFVGALRAATSRAAAGPTPTTRNRPPTQVDARGATAVGSGAVPPPAPPAWARPVFGAPPG
jgi:serine/threonine-protein kinase